MLIDACLEHTLVDIPFEYRHCCWFCGEPSNQYFTFPHQYHLLITCIHPTLSLPTCTECKNLAVKVKADDIFAVLNQVKDQLINRYRKDLAIGVNWTKQTLEQSQFDGGNFEGFKRSAWFMFEVAKSRVNYRAWQLELNGLKIEDNYTQCKFTFDGVNYPNVNVAINHYGKIFKLDKSFLTQLVYRITSEHFSRAVSLARIHIDATDQEKRAILNQF